MKQKTLAKEVSFSGVGLHTGKNSEVSVLPAAANTGYKFIRVDVEPVVEIPADPSTVVSTSRGTSLGLNGVVVHTVEHLLSALYATGIDNATIEVNGDEIPIMDGSAADFVKKIHSAGIVDLEEDCECYEFQSPILYRDPATGSEVQLVPSAELELISMIDFGSKVLGPQYATLTNFRDYHDEIAPCRTFVFVEDLESLIEQGLIKGGTLDNALVIADREIPDRLKNRLSARISDSAVSVQEPGVVNPSKMKFPNEPARHKLLDLIGDLALVGVRFKGKVIATKPGHKTNVGFAKALKKQVLKQRKLGGIPHYDPEQSPVYDINKIRETLPHRFPFLLVDKILELSEDHVVGVKNITADQYFFQGHFPGNPIFPGVLQIEAMAQTGGVLALSTVEDPENWDTYFLKIDKVKFKHKVIPGDTLLLKLKLLRPIRRGICYMAATAYVGERVVSEGELTAQIIKRTS